MNNNNDNKEGNENNNIKEEKKEEMEHVYLNEKIELINYIKSKINVFYRGKDIKDKDYIIITKENIEIVIKRLELN